MKKNIKVAILTLVLLMLLSVVLLPETVKADDQSISQLVNNVDKLTIKPVNKSVEVGDKINITVDIESYNNILLDNYWQFKEDEFAIWESSNENVIKLLDVESLHNSIFEAVGIGTATLTLSMGGKSDSITITVNGLDGTSNDVGRIVLDKLDNLKDLTEDKKFYVGEYLYLDATLYYGDESGSLISDESYYDLIEWKSSDDNILKYVGDKETGNFIVNGFGTVTITATVGNNSDSITLNLVQEGELITSEEHLFKYINECLKSGIYNIKFSKRSTYKVTMDEIDAAVELSGEYLYQGITNATYDGEELQDYDWAPFNYEEDSEGNIVSLNIEGIENYKSFIDKADKKADQIINKIITDNMTDEQKLKAIFSYLVINCKLYIAVDKENWGERIDNLNYTPYNVLILKKGNMAGVSRTFNLLTRKAGIQSMKLGDVNTLGILLGDRCYNVVRVNNELKYFSFVNMYSDFVTEKEQRAYIKKMLEDGFMLSSIKGYTNDDVKYNKNFLNYVVVEKNELLVNIKVSSALSIEKGKSKSIKITLPNWLTKVTKYTDKDGEVIITYKSDNSKIASVSKTGKVTGKKKGTALITTTVHLSDGSKKIFNTEVAVK